MTLLELIAEEMASDTDNPAKQSARLEQAYDDADDIGRKLVDDVLICLCGWSLPTLRQKLSEQDEGES